MWVCVSISPFVCLFISLSLSLIDGNLSCRFFCNAIVVSLLYIHANRTAWKIRSWPKSVILKIKMIQKDPPPPPPPLSLSLCTSTVILCYLVVLYRMQTTQTPWNNNNIIFKLGGGFSRVHAHMCCIVMSVKKKMAVWFWCTSNSVL